MLSTREKFKFKNTLICLLKALEGVKTTVELRNENVVNGKILFVDGRMNLTMENVVFKPVKGAELKFTDFYVQGPQIRFVQIPDYIDIRRAMEKQLLRGQAVFTNISKSKDERQRFKQKRREKNELKMQKREARMLSQQTPRDSDAKTSGASDV